MKGSSRRKRFSLLCAFVFVASLFVGASISAAETMKVVFIGPLTGASAFQGVSAKNAMEAAFEKGRSGLPFSVELAFLDDQGNPETAKKLAEEVGADAAVRAVIGHFNSACALAALDAYHAAKLPAVIWGAVHPDITGKGYPEISRLPAQIGQYSKRLADLLMDQGYASFAVLGENTSYGELYRKTFVESVTARSGQIVLDTSLEKGAKIFTEVVEAVAGANPQAVFFAGFPPEGALLKMQLDRKGVKALFAVGSGISDPMIIRLAKGASEGIVGIQEKPLDSLPGGKAFMDAYAAKGFAEPPQSYSFFAYDAMNLILSILKGNSAVPSREALATAIRGASFEGVAGNFSFDANGQSNMDTTAVFVIEGAQWVPWEASSFGKGSVPLPGK